MKSTNSNWNSKIFFGLLLALIVVFKIYFGNTGFLNFEGNFFELARQLASSFSPLKEALYFQNQANPIGTSLVLSFLGPSPWGAHLPGVMLVIPCAALLFITLRKSVHEASDFFLVLISLGVLVHPSIWAFTGKALSDSFYIVLSLAVLSLYILYREKPQKGLLVLLALLLFLAPFFKLNSLALLAVLGLDVFWDYLQGRKSWTQIHKEPRILLAAAMLLGLEIYSKITQFYDIPFRQNNEMLMQLSIAEMFRNSMLYGLHFFLVCAPVTLLNLYALARRSSRKELIGQSLVSGGLFFIFLVGFSKATLFNTGELNFGSFLDQIFQRFYPFLAPPLLLLSTFHLVSLAWSLVQSLRKNNLAEDRLETWIALAYLGLILFHCFVKPVQRYLVVLIFLNSLHFLFLHRGRLVTSASFRQWSFRVAGGLFATYFAASLLLSTQTQIRSDAYWQLGEKIRASGQYGIENDNDPLKGNLFGNIPDAFLKKDLGRPMLCVQHVGFSAPDFHTPGAVFEARTQSAFPSRSFYLSAAPCAGNPN